jgi:hypothetical protein
MTILDQFLETIESKLPEILSDKDLIHNVPEFFKSPSALSRLRSQKQSPAHFSISPSCVRYLRADVIAWLKNRYHQQGE